MSARPPQIVAFGGGGFSMEWGNPLLDDHVLALTGVEHPKVCFLPTASGDADHYVVRFYRAFPAPRCEPSHISLFRRETGVGDPRAHLLAQDVIYVGGGSLVSLMGTWRAHGIDVALHEAWRAGVVLCGGSAGSLCWFSHAVSALSRGPARGSRAWASCRGATPCTTRDEPGRRDGVPRRGRRRDAARLRRRRRRGAALRRHRAGRGGVLPPGGAGDATCSPTASGGATERELPVRYLGEPEARGVDAPRRHWWAARRSPRDAPARGARAPTGACVILAVVPDQPGERRRILAMGGGGFTMQERSPGARPAGADADRQAGAEDLLSADRQRRRARADDPLLRAFSGVAVRAEHPVAVSPRSRPARPGRASARPGRDLRRRRLDAQHARDLARARRRRGDARRLGARGSCWPG